MTNKEVIIHLIGSNADYSEADLTIAMQLAGIVPDDEYSSSDRCKIYGFVLRKIQGQKSVKKITEGGYSVEYSDSATPGVLQSIANESGCKELIDEFSPNPRPKVRDKSNIW